MTTTVNYSWALPTVGASVNTWGTLVNNILIDIDAKMFARTGGAISGNVSVAGSVTATVNGSDSISNHVYGQNVAGTRAFNWQLTASGNPALWAYNGSSWSKVAEGSSTGLAVNGSLSSTGTLTSGSYISAEKSGSVCAYIGSAADVITGGAAADMALTTPGSANLIFGIANYEKMRLDASGNLGLGVTPSAWSSSFKALQVRGFGLMAGPTGNTYQLANAYFDGAYRYFSSSPALKYEMTSGSYTWSIAPSGTAGNAISWNQAMTLDAYGNLAVGTTGASGRKLYTKGPNAGGYITSIENTSGTTPYGFQVYLSGVTGGTGAGFIDCTDDVTRFRVMGNGNVQNINNSYGAISSKLYKENIADASPKLAKLLKVRIVNYNLINDPAKLKQIGVIWEELNEISPGLCGETPDYEEVTLTREVEKTVPVTVKKEVTTERIQLDVIDGVAVQKVIRETSVIAEPVVDEYPVFDGDGNPVMEVVTPATEAEIDDKGNEIKAATPAVLRQKIHAVPRMETVVEKEEYTERRLTGTTTKSVKYSIFVPMLIKAMQEQQEQIEALKAKVGA